MGLTPPSPLVSKMYRLGTPQPDWQNLLGDTPLILFLARGLTTVQCTFICCGLVWASDGFPAALTEVPASLWKQRGRKCCCFPSRLPSSGWEWPGVSLKVLSCPNEASESSRSRSSSPDFSVLISVPVTLS